MCLPPPDSSPRRWATVRFGSASVGTFLHRNWFVVALILGVCLAGVLRVPIATVDPGAGTRDAIRDWTVITIFVLIGMSLPSERILPSLVRLRVHLLFQASIFVVMPLAVTAMVAAARGSLLTEGVVVGLYAVAVLPTTGSSCVVFTQAARGDVVIATANAAIANTAGILLSPVLLSILLGTQGRAMPNAQLFAVIQGLAIRMLLPLVVGQLLRATNRAKVAAGEARLRDGSAALIVVVVFLSTSAALDAGFGDLLSASMAAGIALLGLLHVALLPLLYRAGAFFSLSHEERVALVFTGSQKTLALGAPLLSLYFADRPDLFASALVPLMFYHLWQLVVGGFARNRLLAIAS